MAIYYTQTTWTNNTRQSARYLPYVNLPRLSTSKNPLLGSPTTRGVAKLYVHMFSYYAKLWSFYCFNSLSLPTRFGWYNYFSTKKVHRYHYIFYYLFLIICTKFLLIPNSIVGFIAGINNYRLMHNITLMITDNYIIDNKLYRLSSW